MERLLVIAMLGGVFLGQTASAQQAQQLTASGTTASSGTTPGTTAPTGRLTDVPPLPKSKSTILGGAIASVDPVRDQMVLHVYGEKPMKILYDERTQIFRDGKKIALRDLGPSAHASVQTTLDDSKVFAITVHILSQQPGGNYEGRVMSYNPDSGELMLTSTGNGQPFRVLVTKDTSFQRTGQSAFSSVQSSANDLQPGSLISLQFSSDNRGKGIAQQVTVLAAPGASFVFAGTLESLDMHTAQLMLLDPRTNTRYQISFDPTRAPAQQLRPGQRVRVEAAYNGSKYVASGISIE